MKHSQSDRNLRPLAFSVGLRITARAVHFRMRSWNDGRSVIKVATLQEALRRIHQSFSTWIIWRRLMKRQFGTLIL
jgi:hypothetical protein